MMTAKERSDAHCTGSQILNGYPRPFPRDYLTRDVMTRTTIKTTRRRTTIHGTTYHPREGTQAASARAETLPLEVPLIPKSTSETVDVVVTRERIVGTMRNEGEGVQDFNVNRTQHKKTLHIEKVMYTHWNSRGVCKASCTKYVAAVVLLHQIDRYDRAFLVQTTRWCTS